MIKFSISDEDIRLATELRDRDNVSRTESCPITLALRRQFNPFIKVGLSNITPSIKEHNYLSSKLILIRQNWDVRRRVRPETDLELLTREEYQEVSLKEIFGAEE
jgi:hypothetical protein